MSFLAIYAVCEFVDISIEGREEVRSPAKMNAALFSLLSYGCDIFFSAC